MTIKTVKGRDLPDIYAHDKVRFVLEPVDKELEAYCFVKHTKNMSNGTVTIYLRYSGKDSEKKVIDQLCKQNKKLTNENTKLRIENEKLLDAVADYRRILSRGYPGYF